MSKRALLIVLGIVSVLVAVIGLPESWKEIYFVLAGAAVAVIGFFMRAPKMQRTETILSAETVSQ